MLKRGWGGGKEGLRETSASLLFSGCPQGPGNPCYVDVGWTKTLGLNPIFR